MARAANQRPTGVKCANLSGETPSGLLRIGRRKKGARASAARTIDGSASDQLPRLADSELPGLGRIDVRQRWQFVRIHLDVDHYRAGRGQRARNALAQLGRLVDPQA